jgi:glycosyltransferase involved in cell wall biosynthesis
MESKAQTVTTGLPHVAVLMGTYCGEAFLAEQLASISRQQHTHWSLWASDDGSMDTTRSILDRYRDSETDHAVTLRQGPGRGFAANFLSLLNDPGIQADYYAFSDQDDIWYPEKLQRALGALEKLPMDRPALYTARARLIDAKGIPCGLSPANRRQPGFANALVQNIASGNTMVMNDAARRLVYQAQRGEQTGLHDWWCYLLISGCGGNVIFDPEPCLDYRQHDNNLIGMRTGWCAMSARIQRLWHGRHRDQVQRNLQALYPLKEQLTPDNVRRLESFCRSRQGGAFQRLQGLHQAGVYRQTLAGNAAMWLATFLNKL